MRHLKRILFIIGLLGSLGTKAQDVQSIHVNLYTDSLKKGTFNYINVDGQLSNGRYLPLDTTQLRFSCSAGRFEGNSLWIDKDIKENKVNIKVVLKKNPALTREFVIYVKQLPDPQLKTMDEIMNGSSKKNRKG